MPKSNLSLLVGIRNTPTHRWHRSRSQRTSKRGGIAGRAGAAAARMLVHVLHACPAWSAVLQAAVVAGRRQNDGSRVHGHADAADTTTSYCKLRHAAAGRKDPCTLGLDGRHCAHSVASLDGSWPLHAVPATATMQMRCNVPFPFLFC